ncbi:Leukotriene A-4 hydrolase-like protein 2, partial [Colletotrichum chlorophyti]
MCFKHEVTDINTNCNFKDVVTKHTKLELTIDFDRRILTGQTAIHLEVRIESLSEVILDTSFLAIKEVSEVSCDGSLAKWTLNPPQDANGSPLRIELGKKYGLGETLELRLSFETTQETTGLQWFGRSQTDDKRYPFMCKFWACLDQVIANVADLECIVSQGEPVHARSMFPCQDTPSVKTTFDIIVHSTLPVVASGIPEHDLIFPEVEEPLVERTYKFNQTIPISNYLFAVASGNLAGVQVGPKSYVYCAPGDIDACKAEFEADLQAIIKSAESLIFEYPWPLYNLVVLPKSFHLGGMENPVFNFYSATVVSGDRENISVVAHEFAHSYSGNLVTNSRWEDFWLNEGWTVYIERHILRSLRGDEEVELQAIVGWQDLLYNIEAYGGNDSVFTSLVLQFDGKRPDDIMSKISYEKGYTFLCYLEQQVGKKQWLKFVPHYFKTFFGSSVSSEQFKSCVLDFFSYDATATSALEAVDWNGWYYKPGAPPKPVFGSQLYENCLSLAEKWRGLSKDASFEPSANNVEGWTVTQLLVFLDLLIDSPESIPLRYSEALGDFYGVKSSRNLEVVSRYLRVALRAGDRKVLEQTQDVLAQTGRMKFVKPLFEGLIAVDEKLALEVFKKQRDFYHPTCIRLIKGVLEKKGLSIS